MPKVTLIYADEAAIPTELKAFKTTDNKVEVWVGANQDAVAAEFHGPLVANRDTILAEKNTFETKYKALVETSTKDDVETAKKIAALELKTQNPIPESDKKLLDAIKTAKADATPEYVAQAVKEFPVVSEKLTSLETTKNNDALFEKSGYKDRTVFETVLKNKDLNPNMDSVIWKDEKDTAGNAVKVPYVKVKTAVDGKVELPFTDYVKATPEWNPFMPSLNAGTQPQPWGAATQNPQQPNVGGTSGMPTNNFLDQVQQGMAKVQQPKVPAPIETK